MRQCLLFQCLMIGLATTTSGCKPKLPENSQTASVIGVDAQNRAAAFGLLPVRNFVLAATDAGSTDPGTVQASRMVNARLFGLIECNDYRGAGGNVSAAGLVELLEALGASDNLYLTPERDVITKPGLSQIDRYSTPMYGAKLRHIPCHLFGERLLSWDVVADLQTRAAGLPATIPQSPAHLAAAKRTFLVNQTLFLALRGKFVPGKSEIAVGTVTAMVEMATIQGGQPVTVADISARLTRADSVYNPCVPSSNPTYTDLWKKENFACVAAAGVTHAFTYKIGGSSAAHYTDMRNLLAVEIARTHMALHTNNAGDLDLARLWEVVTSGRPWRSSSGALRELGLYLATGKGVDFGERFDSKNAAYRVGTAMVPEVPSNSVVRVTSAPLLVTLPSKMRSRSIYRATP